MTGIVARMRQHHCQCSMTSNNQDAENSPALVPSTSPGNPVQRKQASSPDHSHQDSPAKRQKQASRDSSIKNFVVQTSATLQDQLDLQVTRFVYATNTAFTAVEHPEFVKMVQMLCPGYRPPSHKQVGGELLDDVQTKLMEECKEQLQVKTVAMSLDGWSNIHNELVVCVSLTTAEGHTYLTETVDTSGHRHTLEYLEKVAIGAMKSAETQFSCRVASL